MDFLEQLNPPQRQAVTAGAGPVLVLAGPGSGKTRVLTQRVAWLIANQGVRPYQLLAVTFTNKAAREMEKRVHAMLGQLPSEGLWLGTFHALCARLLRREAEHLPFNSNFVIYDQDDQQQLVKSVIRELNLDDKQYRPPSVHASISRAKNELILPQAYPTQTYRDEVVQRIYLRYQELLQQSNAVDFDDLLLWTAQLLSEFPAVREKYARRFLHVLVDEFQDTNFVQYVLIKQLASVHNNIFCVGDPDQCFPAGTRIATPAGDQVIESVREGQAVLAAGDGGVLLPSTVRRVGSRFFSGSLVQVITRSGLGFRCTPNHLVFSRPDIPGCLSFLPVPGSPAGFLPPEQMPGFQPGDPAGLDLAVPGQPRGGSFFRLSPAGALGRSTHVAVQNHGQVEEDEIVELRRQEYEGDVYDLEVEKLHNYLAAGVVVHNSIYRWRGADYHNVQRFEQDFPQAQVVLLEQNYRSKQTILDAAMSVIDRAPNRRRKQLFTERGTGEKLFYYEALDDYAEAAFVVDTISSLVASSSCQPGDCAVMYRTNAQSRLLEEAFLQARLPYRLVGAQRFYGRREVKDLLAYLRLVHDPADEVSLERILNVPPRGIGEKTLLALATTARSVGLAPGVLLLDLARADASPFWSQIPGRSAVPLAEFSAQLGRWRAEAQRDTVTELFDRIVSDIRYPQHLDDGTEEGAERLENLQELRRLTTEYSSRSIEEFLQDVALISDQDTLSEGKNAPTLLTLHAAKGLEFGTVFIVGLDDGILPHSRSFDDPEAMEEERRLLYVGITRAKDRLYLLRALRRGGRNMNEETLPSRYLEDIPTELLAGRTRSGQSLRESSRGLSPAWLRSEPVENNQPTVRFRAGLRVRHSTWGEGIVLNSKIQDNDETVEVVFESVGIKRLAASLARLEILTQNKK
jgi:superfamily I DNA/RNA helicase